MSDQDAPGTTALAANSGGLSEYQKWVDECKFRQEELELKRAEQRRLVDELAFKVREAERSRWWNPLVIARIAAALAAGGNAAVAWLNGTNLQKIEEQKAESERIIAAMKTGDPDNAVVNLKFLADAGLIRNTKTAKYITDLVKEG